MNTKDLNYMNQLYECPNCRVIEIDSQELICTSTEGYGLNPNGLREDDWE